VLPLFEFFSAHGDPAAARDVLDEALARAPDAAALRLLRTETLLAEGQLELARAELGRLRAVTFDGDPQLEYLGARLALAEGDARGAAERLRDLAPRLDTAATQYWLGRALEASGDLQGARRRYALAEHRDRAWTAPAVAQIALAQRSGDWRAVAGAAEGLVRRAPHELAGWVAMVEALENLGDGAAAERVARDSLERFPDRAEPQLLLARALRAQDRTDEALAALEAAQRLEPSRDLDAERVATLGLGGRVEQGIEVAREALVREPDSAALQAALASLLFAAGAADEGARATDRALALAPDEPRPLRVRCEFRASVRDWAGARDDCTRYVAARPDDAGARFMLGVALGGLGDTDGAAAAYRRAAALDERDARPRNNLAELLAARGDLDGALASAQEAYRLDEKNPYVMDTLGVLYVKKGLPERGVSLLEEAHAGLPEVPEVALHLADAYRAVGRADAAAALLGDRQPQAGADDALDARSDAAGSTRP
jgi:tetratricopeptide (TPR) repeat protein